MDFADVLSVPIFVFIFLLFFFCVCVCVCGESLDIQNCRLRGDEAESQESPMSHKEGAPHPPPQYFGGTVDVLLGMIRRQNGTSQDGAERMAG